MATRRVLGGRRRLAVKTLDTKIPYKISKLLSASDVEPDVFDYFGFDTEKPLFWGAYDGWDGTSLVVTDNTVAWKSDLLAEYAQRLSCSELNTFKLAAIFDRSVGIPVACPERFIPERLHTIIEQENLAIRWPHDRNNCVFFTMSASKKSMDDLPTVVGALCP